MAAGSRAPDESPVVREIERLVDRYLECHRSGAAGMPRQDLARRILLQNNFGPCEEQFLIFLHKDESGRLTWRNRIDQLPFDVVRRIPAILVRPLSTQLVNFDHKVLWSWLAELLRLVNRGATSPLDDEIVEGYTLLVRLALASVGRPPDSEDVHRLNQVADIVVSPHVSAVVTSSRLLSLTLGFPVLERLLKVRCGAFVGTDGSIRQDFAVAESSYRAGGPRRVSSLYDLLCLHQERVAGPAMLRDLQKFKTAFAEALPGEPELYAALYEWRNQMLHGADLRRVGHAVVTNLCSLLILDALEQHYSELARLAAEGSGPRFTWPRFTRTPWEFYPPDLF